LTAQQRLLSLTSNKNLGTGGVWALVILGAGALVGMGWWMGKRTTAV
jgi:hypothetical protein